MPIIAGTRLGPYEVLAPLGAGGMGEVYRARDTRLDREVAIKVLPADFANDADRLKRFEQEARATSALNHPNILTIYDIGTHEGSPYIVAELLEGEELRAQLDHGALPLRQAIDYAQQITQGLSAAHEKGIVHRDLKPENLFVTNDGRVKILDFGLAKLRPQKLSGGVDSEAPTLKPLTDPGVILGTVGYMSPEQVRGQEADHRADIFSFGMILYEMLSGRRAFNGTPVADVMSAILNPEGRAAGVERSKCEDQPGARQNRAALFGEETGATLSISQRSRLCARSIVGEFRFERDAGQLVARRFNRPGAAQKSQAPALGRSGSGARRACDWDRLRAAWPFDVFYIEKCGTGIARMRRAMREHGLAEPRLEDLHDFFAVTFYGPGDRILDLIPEEGETELRLLGLNERQIEALRMMTNEGRELTNSTYRQLFEVSRNTASRDLQGLLQTGWVKTIGNGKGRRYRAV